MNDPRNWRDFEDSETRTWARITETHLVMLDGKHHRVEDLPKEYPLESIRAVRVIGLTGEKIAVAAQIPGLERSPGFTFADKRMARRFADALRNATRNATLDPEARS